MKSFLEFLKESKIDDELGKEDEEIFSILESGELKPVEDFEDDSFESILDDVIADSFGSEIDESEDGNVKDGWGGEKYVSLDFAGLVDEVKKEDGPKEDSETVKTLTNRKENGEESFDRVIARNTKYAVSDDGSGILKRDPSDGKMKPLTDVQIREIMDQRNKPSEGFGHKRNKRYSFDEENNLVANSGNKSAVVSGNSAQRRFLKNLNDEVNSRGLHYRFKSGTAKLMVNTTPWTADGEEENVRDKSRFDRAKYKDVETEDERNAVLDVVNAEKKASGKVKRVLGYENGEFTYDGVPLTKDDIGKLVLSLNGNVGGDTKLLNPKGWGKDTEEYWKSYKISVAGSKIGKAVNFNLPPVVTCNKGVPCIKEGCYAIKAYAAYPAARAAMDCNLALLKNDKNFELFKKSLTLALNTPGKKNGKKFNLCRIHVNGDMISAEYLRAICDVAKECGHVRFWMYTKQYEMLSEFGTTYPDNLCIIVSCWGKFNPFDYEDGKYKDLAKNFPLAYLDDESEECSLLNQRIQETLGKPKDIQVCPCTDAEEIITRCESCRICFDKSLADNNLVFRKH